MRLNQKKRLGCIALTILVASLMTPHSFGEEPLQESVGLSHADIAPNLILISYQVDGEKKTGNGVIVRMEGKPYLLTNLHILLGSEKITFMTAEGKRLSPRSIELSNSRDLVRLALDEDEAGLTISTQAKMNMPIAVYSIGQGKKRKIEHGKIIGVGSGKIEISTAFDDSSNGAPALNARNEVVGIATYTRKSRPEARAKGTRFESISRHFCSRMGKNDWIPVNWKAFNKNYGQAHRKSEALYTKINNIYVNAENYKDSIKETRPLANECRSSARQLERICEKKHDLTDFLLNDFEERIELLEYASQ